MKDKKKIYQNWWFILLGIVIYTVLIIAGTYFITSNIVQETFAEAKNSNTNTNDTMIGKVQKDESEGQTDQLKEATLNSTIQEKDWEVTIRETGFKQDIIPSNPNSYYTHYQVKDTNNTYFYIIADVKNISSIGLRADNVAKVKMKYDNKYEYSAFSTIEESGGGTFTYTNITNIDPLTTRKIYYLVEVPKTIGEENETAVEAEITINDNTYLLKIR